VRAIVFAALREERFSGSGVLGFWGSGRPSTPVPQYPSTPFITGDGPVRAERGAREAILEHNPEAIIGVGIAGGIAPHLKRGDIVVGRDGDPRLVASAVSLGAKPMRIVTTPAIVFDKTTIDADVVDMESAAWQRAAGDIPFVVVRVILDPRDESLPPFLAKCARADGSISRVRVALRALAHPRAIARLARETRAARRILAAFVPRLLASVAAIPYDR